MKADNFNLGDLLRKIKVGEVQLPDFQREWVWDDEQIKSLLESVIRNFPINSILLLECDADQTKFSFRPIKGADESSAKPQYLILDGQQRLTSLFCAMFSDKPVWFKRGKNKFFYVDMKKAVEVAKTSVTVDDMIISVNDNKKLKSKGINHDLSTREKEYAAGMFPLNKIFDPYDWFFGYGNYCANDQCKTEVFYEFRNRIVATVNLYPLAYISLERNTPIAAVCKIFENVNRSGEDLGVFDLLTSVFATHVDNNGEPIKLRADWEVVREDFKDRNLDILTAVDCSDFVTALTLLVSYRNKTANKPVTCKGEDILKLSYTDYLEYKPHVVDGFVEAAKFLAESDNKVTTKKYLPYKSQLIPMAAIFAQLKLSGKYNANARKKIRQWYWCGVFGESYKDGQGSRYAKDITQVMDWINGHKREEPPIIRNTQIGAVRLMSVKTIQSAAYKGMISIIFQHGAKDFFMGSIVNFAENIDIHHIFPKKYCMSHNIPKERFDNIANRTPIMSRTNRTISGDPPSVYLPNIERRAGLTNADVDEILELHLANAEFCRADNFDAFIVDRAKKILDAVEKLTGREVVGRDSPEIKSRFGALLI